MRSSSSPVCTVPPSGSSTFGGAACAAPNSGVPDTGVAPNSEPAAGAAAAGAAAAPPLPAAALNEKMLPLPVAAPAPPKEKAPPLLAPAAGRDGNWGDGARGGLVSELLAGGTSSMRVPAWLQRQKRAKLPAHCAGLLRLTQGSKAAGSGAEAARAAAKRQASAAPQRAKAASRRLGGLSRLAALALAGGRGALLISCGLLLALRRRSLGAACLGLPSGRGLLAASCGCGGGGLLGCRRRLGRRGRRSGGRRRRERHAGKRIGGGTARSRRRQLDAGKRVGRLGGGIAGGAGAAPRLDNLALLQHLLAGAREVAGVHGLRLSGGIGGCGDAEGVVKNSWFESSAAAAAAAAVAAGCREAVQRPGALHRRIH